MVYYLTEHFAMAFVDAIRVDAIRYYWLIYPLYFLSAHAVSSMDSAWPLFPDDLHNEKDKYKTVMADVDATLTEIVGA